MKKNVKNQDRKAFALKKILFVLLFCLATSWSVTGQQSTRLYLVGNSVTDAANYGGIKAIAESEGHTHTWARHMIPGAPLSWLWDNQDSGFTEDPYGVPNNAFPNYTWDAISLQPFDRGLDGTDGDIAVSGKYIDLAIGKSPDVQFYLYGRWPRKPTDFLGTAQEWSDLWNRTFTGGYDGTNESRDYFEQLAQGLRDNHGSIKPVLIIPIGEVFYELNQQMQAGQVSGYNSIWEVYSDGIHTNNVGSYIAGLTVYSTIYKADPRGTLLPTEYGDINSSLVSVIQQAVWDVVSTYSWSGVSSSSIPVSSVSVNPASVDISVGQDSQLSATVLPSDATNKSVNWSSSNSLVASVSSSGLVTATGTGSATITVTTSDGGKTATSSVSVTSSGGNGETTSGVLCNWDFAGLGGSSLVDGSQLLSGITSASASIGAGLNAINYLDDALTASNNNSATLEEAIQNDDYISFTLTPVSGSTVSVNTIEIVPVSQNRERSFALTSSVNGFNASGVLDSFNAHANMNGPAQSIPVSGHDNITGEIEFRLYVYSSDFNVYEAVGIGNASGVDLQVSGSVSNESDTQVPSQPSNLSVSGVRHDEVFLSWAHATDNVGVTGYDVYRGTTKVNSGLVTENSYTITGLTACSPYDLSVEAHDAAGNSSTSNALTVTTNCPPQAVLNASPESGIAPLNVNFDANGSSDPDVDDFILGYEWNFGDGSPLDNSNAPSHTYNEPGEYTVTLRVMDDRDLYSSPVTKTITVTDGVSSSDIPSPWETQDIGNTAIAGNASYTAGTYTVSGSGDDIWASADGFRYVYQTLEGDGEIAVLISSQTNTNSWAKAGVMIRENLTAGSKHAMVVSTPASGVSFQRRVVSDAASTSTTVSGIAAPVWVKIVREGNIFTSYHSSDGAAWTQIGSENISMSSSVNIGMAVTSHNNAEASTAVFENVALSGVSNLRNPDNPSNTENGVDYSYYEGNWDLLPDFGTLTSVKTGNSSNFDLSVREQDDYFGFEFSGFIEVPADGDYTFYTSSDDGSKLYIGEDEVVDNDGLHGTQESNGSIGLKAGKHAIRVVFFEKTGGESLSVSWAGPGLTKASVPSSVLYRASEAMVTGSIVREYWLGISGTSITGIPLETAPTGSDVLTSLEGPVDWNDNYGTRIRGYIVPSTSGTYTFYVSGDDNSELWLSDNSDPAGKAKIAEVTGWTSSREWDKEAGQKSQAVQLESNTPYYVEVLHKEGGGGDNIAVGWTGPGISQITIIPGSNLAPFDDDGTTPPPADTEAPSVPQGLSASNVSTTSLTLSWTASSDNVAVTGYEVFVDGASEGTTTATSMDILGLNAETTYSLSVRARDEAGNWSGQSNAISTTTLPTDGGGDVGDIAKLPVGMNLPSNNYHTTSLVFNDPMKTASEYITYNAEGTSDWDTGLKDQIAYDSNGYPLQIPHPVSGYPDQAIRFLINNHYSGTFAVLYDGDGDLSFHGGGGSYTENGRLYITLNGEGGHVWFQLTRSEQGNHVRNMRIIPVEYENNESAMPTFYAPFLQGLEPFSAVRFMDWIGTNNSNQVYWSDRVTPTYYTQGGSNGMSFDYAIELANELQKDAWFCVPHQADDNYITEMATLVKNNLDPGLDIYIEYSNEIWNWMFDQSNYVLNNAPGHANGYVSSDLAAISPDGNHPEKGAYMFARVFRLWRDAFGSEFDSRVTRVAAGQAGWYSTFDRLVTYLFEDLGEGADAMSPTAYFNFTKEDHETWNAMAPGTVTPDMIIDAVEALWPDYEQSKIQLGNLASRYNMDLVVYEGGQHMQPYLQGDYHYNQAVWDAHIHPRMYDLYAENFRIMTLPEVDCKMFMAFSYVSARESQYGSWGHLESLDQLGTNYMETAPKYQALLDANQPLVKSAEINDDSNNAWDQYSKGATTVKVYPNPVSDVLYVSGLDDASRVKVFNLSGGLMDEGVVVDDTLALPVSEYTSGVYIIRIVFKDHSTKALSFIKN